jgi:hypothetical protein
VQARLARVWRTTRHCAGARCRRPLPAALQVGPRRLAEVTRTQERRVRARYGVEPALARSLPAGLSRSSRTPRSRHLGEAAWAQPGRLGFRDRLGRGRRLARLATRAVGLVVRAWRACVKCAVRRAVPRRWGVPWLASGGSS